MTLRIHNTLSRATEVFVPIEPGHVRLYVCGITIYDHSHMGHARFMMAFDVAQRWLKTLGYRVTYVRNITDVDDKIIRRALERGISIRALTDEMIAALHEDAAALGLEPPTHEPRATQFVPQMIDMIATLEQKGLGYRAPGGDVNFSVRKFPGYGKLSGKSIDQLRAGERVAVLDGKDDPLDFVMWKSAKESEPDDAKWPSPFGVGRPGWHIECSAMCKALLGDHLRHPRRRRRTCSSRTTRTRLRRARVPAAARSSTCGCTTACSTSTTRRCRSRSATSSPSATCSSATTARRCASSCCARTTAARSISATPISTTPRAGLRRLYTALDGVATAGAPVPVDWLEPRAAAFREAMNDDFNTPIAVSILFELANETNRDGTAASAALLRGLGGVLGILQQAPRAYLQAGAGLDEASVTALIEERRSAKAAGNYQRADAIRKRLAEQGIVLKDLAQETTWVRG